MKRRELEEVESVKISLEEHRSTNRPRGGVEEAVSKLGSSDPRHPRDATGVAAVTHAKRQRSGDDAQYDCASDRCCALRGLLRRRIDGR